MLPNKLYMHRNDTFHFTKKGITFNIEYINKSTILSIIKDSLISDNDKNLLIDSIEKINVY